jgi:hypothetical protein
MQQISSCVEQVAQIYGKVSKELLMPLATAFSSLLALDYITDRGVEFVYF